MNEPTLTCSRCDWRESISTLRNLCPACAAPLLVRYELTRESAQFRTDRSDMWRFASVLPAVTDDEIVTLGEGMTPLLPARALGRQEGMSRLLIKDESLNPTRSFKSRGMSAAVTMARKLGATSLAAPTAGNAGCALAAYGARAGLPTLVAMPDDTPRSIADECRQYGAEVVLVAGVITDAAKLVQARIASDGGFDLSTLREPYRVEGKKTMGFELLFDLGGKLPDAIIYPTGGGTGLIGMWKAFAELEELGLIDHRRPRMYSVQAEGCAPIVRAMEKGTEDAGVWESPVTEAWGLRVPRAIGDRLMLRALRESGGGAVAVTEAQMSGAAEEMRRLEGVDAGPEGGASLAGLRRLLDSGAISREETVILFNTGANKYRD
jgi:threonine synthase